MNSIDPNTCNQNNLCANCSFSQQSQQSQTSFTLGQQNQNQGSKLLYTGFSNINQGQNQFNLNNQQFGNNSGQQPAQSQQNLLPLNNGQQTIVNTSTITNKKPQGLINYQQFNSINQNANQFIRHYLDQDPTYAFSITLQQQNIPYLYSLAYQKMFYKVADHSKHLAIGKMYDEDMQSITNFDNFNILDTIPPLSNKKPKKYQQFFHCLNIIMSTTFFVCWEQTIQYSMINHRQGEIIEKALCWNKMFDIDNFMGSIRDSTYKTYKLNHFETMTKNQLIKSPKIKGDILTYLNSRTESPILVQTINSDNDEFLVLKCINKVWYYFNQNSQILQISNSISFDIPDLKSSIEQIDQRKFIQNYFGSINCFYEIEKNTDKDRELDRTLFRMLHQINEYRNYANLKSFWLELQNFG